MSRTTAPKKITTLRHREANRKNIPTAEHSAVLRDDERSPVQIAYQRRNRDLDPQLVWRGKDEQDRGDLIAHAPPLFIQEKVHPKVLIDDLLTHSKRAQPTKERVDLFADFNGLDSKADLTDFYEHDANWSNRMILGDSLHVMASLAEREALRGKVQCIFVDPPYGIKFNSNFQWCTTSRNVKDGNRNHITREPEQVKAFRDTWRDGIHSYLAYLRDRLTAARDLLAESGSVFVQIGDENMHRVRAVMDEVFGDENYVSVITIRKTTSEGAKLIGSTTDFVLWYTRRYEVAKFRRMFRPRSQEADRRYSRVNYDGRMYRLDNIRSSRPAGKGDVSKFDWRGTSHTPGSGTFKTTHVGLERLSLADRLELSSRGGLSYRRFQDDFSVAAIGNMWTDISGAVQSRSDPKIYVVQTSTQLIQRCMLMTTDPGDLVLDPTCGAGTTAYVAEQWGRRWITIDTSRVALTLARARIMGARYPYYLLADSLAGQYKESQITGETLSGQPTFSRVRQGFVYERVPHITLKQIANNVQLDVIWRRHNETLEPLLERLNSLVGTQWMEWEVPRNPKESWTAKARQAHKMWWRARMARQQEIDSSIAADAPVEYLHDKPYQDRSVVRVSGPFTIESLSPHRVLAVGADDEVIGLDGSATSATEIRPDFARMILNQLRTSGIQQVKKMDRIELSALTGWPGKHVCAVGQYVKASRVQRAGILIGPEFGTVSRPDLAAAAREAAEAGFDALIACAFNYDAASTDFASLGRVPIIKARINADLHMADELKNTGNGNVFVVFGEPDIEVHYLSGRRCQVEIKGVDIFHPATGEIRSENIDGIACWFIDTNYNEESFFVRQAYFLGKSDPYRALKTTLKSQIDYDTWATVNNSLSRPFEKPVSGRICVKVINHFGDEAMRVLRV